MAITTNDPATFWAAYEKEIGEKVLGHALGRYLAGWAEFRMPLWGLLIATDAGFRFHHFPHEGWIQALSRVTGGGGDPAAEKTLFLPLARIRSIELEIERSWLKKVILARQPLLTVHYAREDGGDAYFLAEADKSAMAIADALKKLLPTV